MDAPVTPPPVLPPLDPAALAALNERFAPRVQALWASVMRDGATAASHDASHAPADRRFAGRAWRELPYFALLKDSYLLYADYLRELAALAHLPPAEQQRLRFATRQYVDAIAPTNFPATNPEVMELALRTEGQS